MDKQPVQFGRRKGLQPERQTAQASPDVADSIPTTQQQKTRLIVAASGIAADDQNVSPAYAEVVPSPAAGNQQSDQEDANADRRVQTVDPNREVAVSMSIPPACTTYETNAASKPGFASYATHLGGVQAAQTARKLHSQESTGSQGAWMASMFDEPHHQDYTKPVVVPNSNTASMIKPDVSIVGQQQLESVFLGGNRPAVLCTTDAVTLLETADDKTIDSATITQADQLLTTSATSRVITNNTAPKPVCSFNKQDSRLSEDQMPWMASLFKEDLAEIPGAHLIKAVPACDNANVPVWSNGDVLRTHDECPSLDTAVSETALTNVAAGQVVGEPSIQSMGWYSERDICSRRNTVTSICSVSLDTFLVHTANDNKQSDMTAAVSQEATSSAQHNPALSALNQLKVAVPTTIDRKQSTTISGNPLIGTAVSDRIGTNSNAIASSCNELLSNETLPLAAVDVAAITVHEDSLQWYSETGSRRRTGDSTVSVGLDAFNMSERPITSANDGEGSENVHRTSLGFTPAESVAAKVSAWEAKLTQSQKLSAEGLGLLGHNTEAVQGHEEKGITTLIQACASQAMLQACDESLVRISQGGSPAMPASKALFLKSASQPRVPSVGGGSPNDAQQQPAQLQARSASSSFSGKLVTVAPSPLELLSQELLTNEDGGRLDGARSHASPPPTSSCASAIQRLLSGNSCSASSETRQLHPETAALLSNSSAITAIPDSAEEQRKQILQAADLARQQLLRAIEQHDTTNAPESDSQHASAIKATEQPLGLHDIVAFRSFSQSAAEQNNLNTVQSALDAPNRHYEDATRISPVVQPLGLPVSMERTGTTAPVTDGQQTVPGSKTSLLTADTAKEASYSTLGCSSISSMHNIIPCVGQDLPDLLHTQQAQQPNFPMLALAQTKTVTVLAKPACEHHVSTEQDTGTDTAIDVEAREVGPCLLLEASSKSYAEADTLAKLSEDVTHITGVTGTDRPDDLVAIETNTEHTTLVDPWGPTELPEAEAFEHAFSEPDSELSQAAETDASAPFAMEAHEVISVEPEFSGQSHGSLSSYVSQPATNTADVTPMETASVPPPTVEISEVDRSKPESEMVQLPAAALPLSTTRKVSVGPWPPSATARSSVLPIVLTSQLISHELELTCPESASEVSSPRQRKPSVSIISFGDHGSVGTSSPPVTPHTVYPIAGELRSARTSQTLSLPTESVVQQGNNNGSRPASRTPRYSAPVRGLAADGKLVAALALLHGTELERNGSSAQTGSDNVACKPKQNRSASPGRCVSPRLRPARQAVEDILHYLHEQHALRHAAQPCGTLSSTRNTPNPSGTTEDVETVSSLNQEHMSCDIDIPTVIDGATKQQQYIIELLGEDAIAAANGFTERVEVIGNFALEEGLHERKEGTHVAALPAGLPAALVPVANSMLSDVYNPMSASKPITAAAPTAVHELQEENVGLGFEHSRIVSHSVTNNVLPTTLDEQLGDMLGHHPTRVKSASYSIPGVKGTTKSSSPTRHRTSVTIIPNIPVTAPATTPHTSKTTQNVPEVPLSNSSCNMHGSHARNIRVSSAVLARPSSGQACRLSTKAGSPAKSPNRQSKASEYLRLLQMSDRKSAAVSNVTVSTNGAVSSPPPASMRKISANLKDVSFMSVNPAVQSDYTYYTFTPQKHSMQGAVAAQNILVTPSSVRDTDCLNSTSGLQSLVPQQTSENANQVWCPSLQLDVPLSNAEHNIQPPSSPFKTLQHPAGKQLAEVPAHCTAQNHVGWVTHHASFRQLPPAEIQRAIWSLLQRKHDEQGKAAAEALSMMLHPDNGLEQLMSQGLTPVEASHLTSLTKMISGHKVLTPHERMGLWTQIEKILLSRLSPLGHEPQRNSSSFVTPLQQPRSPRYPHVMPSTEEPLGRQASSFVQPHGSCCSRRGTVGLSPAGKLTSQQTCTPAATSSICYKQSWSSYTPNKAAVVPPQGSKRGKMSPHVKIVDVTRPSSAATLAAYRNTPQNGGNKVDATLSGAHRVVAPNATMALAMDRQWNAARYQQ